APTSTPFPYTTLFRSQRIERFDDDVDPLLVRESCDHCEQRPSVLQAQLVQQRRTTLVLPLERADPITRDECVVVRRVPDARVDPVQDAGECAPAEAQQPVESGAELGRLDFAR